MSCLRLPSDRRDFWVRFGAAALATFDGAHDDSLTITVDKRAVAR